MNTTNFQKQAQQKNVLPQLIKQSTTYKLIVPRKVEEKIQYLLRKFPSTEWSGVLFTSHTGTFENNDLVIMCEDIYPMDLGNTTYTNFNMNEDVAAYIADNIELFDCDCQLVHSHHNMSAYFSSTDINTLQEEGNERNCFVSLIVNNAGTYCAAVTRKVKTKCEVTVKNLNQSYEFFGEGEKSIKSGSETETTQVVDKEIIQYFMLEVEREEVVNTLSWLDDRFEAIKKKKAETQKNNNSADDSFWFWLHSKETQSSQQELPFESPTPLKDISTEGEANSDWAPDPTIIHQNIAKMLTCSFLINKDIDLNAWVNKSMMKKYNEIFEDKSAFTEWKDFIIEFLVNHYCENNAPINFYENPEDYQNTILDSMYRELCLYPENKYIKSYKETLETYYI